MFKWLQLTKLADTEYRNKEYQVALHFYEEALASVDLSEEQLMDEPESTISALAVSHLNLATLYGSLNRDEMVSQQFETAMYSLINLLSPKAEPELVGHYTLKACNLINLEWATYINTCSEKVTENGVQRYIDAKQALHGAISQLTYKAQH